MIVGNIDDLIKIVGFTLTLFGALTVAAVFVFRARKNVAAYRTFWLLRSRRSCSSACR